MENGSCSRLKACIVLATLLLGTLGVAVGVFSEKGIDDLRSVDPPGIPTNPNPSNNAKGLTGNTITLMWQPNENYRGNHKDIDKSWVKVSTVGPVYSDQAPADIHDASTTGTAQEISIKMATTYYWAVKCHDEDGWGDYSNWKFTTNFPPEAKILKPSSGTLRESVDIEFSGEASDSADGDAIKEYIWESSIDGTISNQRSFTTNSLSIGDHDITFTARDDENQWSVIDDDTTVNVVIEENHGPTAPRDLAPRTTHSLNPQITWYPSSDEDDDPISYNLKIGTTYGDDNILNIETDKSFYTMGEPLTYSNTYNNGQSIKAYYLEIFATDSFGKSSPTVEQILQVVNHVPTEPVLFIGPDDPTISDELKLEIVEDSIDADGDKITYNIQWFCDYKESTQFANKYVIPKDDLKSGQFWEAEVMPNDGIHDGPRGSFSTTIVNTPPVITIDSPIDGAQIYNTESLRLIANGTSDPDNLDPYNVVDVLRYKWRAGTSILYDGEQSFHIINPNPLSPGTHEITLEVFDGKNTVWETRTITVVEKKYPRLSARINVEDVLYEGDISDIEVVVTNSGEASASNINMILYNDISEDLLVQPYEKIEEWKIKKLGIGESHSSTFKWRVEKSAHLFVKIDGNNLGAKDIMAMTQNREGDLDSITPEITNKTVESEGIPFWLWIVIILLVAVLLSGGGFLIYYNKYHDDGGDEFEDDPFGRGGSYGAGMGQAEGVNNQLAQLQNIINTYLPQYAQYAQTPGYPALPPATTDANGNSGQLRLPAGPTAYQMYNSQYSNGPSYTQPPSRLALPPGPPGPPAPPEPNPFMTPIQQQPLPSTFVQPEAPPFTQQPYPAYDTQELPPISPKMPNQSMDLSPFEMPPMDPSTVYKNEDIGMDGLFGERENILKIPEISPDELFNAPPIPKKDIIIKPPISKPKLIVDGNKDTGTMPKMVVGEEGKTSVAKPKIVVPKDEKETILCHICQSIIPDTDQERPYTVTCKSCGEQVMVK